MGKKTEPMIYTYGLGNVAFPVYYDVKNKFEVIKDHMEYMLNRTQSMFRYEGLPETIPQRSLELFLQVNGHVCITKVNGSLYALTGGRGGEPDPYYMPTLYTVANPALNFSGNLKIDEECVVIPNDPMYKGLMPMFCRHATALAENELSLFMAEINSRIQTLLTAPDDSTKQAAELYLKRVFDGELGVIADESFMESLKAQPYGSISANGVITNLIEFEQYEKACWYNEIGLQSNYNMKRESINSNEAQLNEDALYPLLDEMLKMRQEALKKVNEMFGTEISVSLASAWEDNQTELDAELQIIENESEDPAELTGEEVTEDDPSEDSVSE